MACSIASLDHWFFPIGLALLRGDDCAFSPHRLKSSIVAPSGPFTRIASMVQVQYALSTCAFACVVEAAACAHEATPTHVASLAHSLGLKGLSSWFDGL
jgi:hypothetical protein